MTQAIADILEDVEKLSEAERVELTDRLVESLKTNTSHEVIAAHLDEVRQRIQQVEDGATTLVPGEVAIQQIRKLVTGVRESS